MAKDSMMKEEILAAIRRAADELGRAPSRGELRRITGLSHYRVLSVFPTLREAVRAAGLEPNPKGEKISTEDLLADWKRVAEKLGRRPSRAEYVREGKYSAGALTVRFGRWGRISTTEDTENHRGGKARKVPERSNHKGHEGPQRERGAPAKHERVAKPGDFLLPNFVRMPLAQVPTPLVGMRRVTEAVAQMVVNTLLSPANARATFAGGPDFASSNWQLAISQTQNRFTTEGTEEHGGQPVKRANEIADAQVGTRSGREDFFPLRSSVSSVVKKDRPVLGEPFDRSPMTNAPVNELGVMVLFGMVAAGLGLQVESVQGKFPDCMAKRQVAPGKWQHLRIEFEYESKNFKLHGHDPKGCDMIVCWRHNWKECPVEIEVVELSRLVGRR
jgi:Homing endonuclease associated repeat